MTSFSRRAVLLALGTTVLLGVVGRVGAEPASGRRYRLAISGMT